MSWISVREIIQFIAVLSVIFLFGLGQSVGLGLNDSIQHSGITVAHLLIVGQLYILFSFWKRYI